MTDNIETRHPVDYIEPELSADEAKRLVAEWFGRVLVWASQASSLVQMGQRLYVILYVLKPALIEGMTLEAIGAQNQVTRQAIDKLVTDFRDTFGVKSHVMRPEQTRKRCKQSQLTRT
jgi:hypothetical protein